MASRAVIVLGMMRSGTSIVARGLQALGVHFGVDLLAPNSANPTGFYEDMGVLRLNRRLLTVLGVGHGASLISAAAWRRPELSALRSEAVGHVLALASNEPLWGFKQPRTVRVLPFWLDVMRQLDVDDGYVVAIRSPYAVASSLLERKWAKSMAEAQLLTMAHLVPMLHLIASKPMVVVDYDRLMDDPYGQLSRVQRALSLPIASEIAIAHFVERHINQKLRHESARGPGIGRLMKETHRLLSCMASDSIEHAEFWAAWGIHSSAVRAMLTERHRSRGGQGVNSCLWPPWG